MQPILMKRDEVLTLAHAAYRARRSEDTIRRWCRRHGIARQAGQNAPLEISAPALEMLLHSDFEALGLLREGRRDHPFVQRYLNHLGLPA